MYRQDTSWQGIGEDILKLRNPLDIFDPATYAEIYVNNTDFTVDLDSSVRNEDIQDGMIGAIRTFNAVHSVKSGTKTLKDLLGEIQRLPS